MGVFDFIKGAGEKLLELNPAVKAAEVLAAQVRKYKLGGDDLKVESQGGEVRIAGSARSQEEKEKMILAVGNVNGVERVVDEIIIIDPAAPGPAPAPPTREAAPAAAATAPAGAVAQFYTVQKGDTLSKIAKQFYGSAQKYNRIFDANRPLLQHPDKIYPGQVLRIPPAA